LLLFSITPPHPRATLFPYTTLFRSETVMWSRTLRASISAIALVVVIGSAAPSHAFSEISFEYFESNLSPYGSWHVSASFGRVWRSEEHTSELQSRSDLVCRLLLEKK